MKIRLCSPLGLVAVGASVSLAQGPAASNLAYESFDYPAKPNLAGSSGGTGWSGPWADIGTLPTGVAASGLSYPNLPVSGGAAKTQPWTSIDYSFYWRGLAPYAAPDGRLYISFLMRPDAGFGGWHGLRFGKYPKALQFGAPLGMYQYGMMLSEGLTSLSNVPVIEGQTAFVVLEITSAGTGSKYELFVNPVAGQPRPAFSNATMAIGGTVLPTALEIVSDGGFTTDEIRVGLTWESVTGGAAACYADCDASGTLSIDDFICFQTLFALADPAADCDASGTLSIDDFICFQTLFAIGC